jgi:hypothetical protein
MKPIRRFTHVLKERGIGLAVTRQGNLAVINHHLPTEFDQRKIDTHLKGLIVEVARIESNECLMRLSLLSGLVALVFGEKTLEVQSSEPPLAINHVEGSVLRARAAA